MASTTSIVAATPPTQLAPNSAQIINRYQTKFSAWTSKSHSSSYKVMQIITQTWKREKLAEEYLIYSKIVDSSSFSWEMIPYRPLHFPFGYTLQQREIIRRIVFGSITLSLEERKKLREEQLKLYTIHPVKVADIPCKGTDSFCDDDTIVSLCVLKGKKANVFLCNAFSGVEGESIHFRVATKEHRQAFTEVTKKEYGEVMELTTKLIKHFKATREGIKDVYLFNKKGIDQGAAVDHWHLHVIFSVKQDNLGKLAMLKDAFFGSSRMNETALKIRVKDLRNELENLKQSSEI